MSIIQDALNKAQKEKDSQNPQVQKSQQNTNDIHKQVTAEKPKETPNQGQAEIKSEPVKDSEIKSQPIKTASKLYPKAATVVTEEATEAPDNKKSKQKIAIVMILAVVLIACLIYLSYILFFSPSKTSKEAPPKPATPAAETTPAEPIQEKEVITEPLLPTEGTMAAQPEKRAKPHPSLSLNGIFHSDEGDSYVIINGKILKIGEEIKKAEVKSISENEVVLDFFDEEIILELK